MERWKDGKGEPRQQKLGITGKQHPPLTSGRVVSKKEDEGVAIEAWGFLVVRPVVVMGCTWLGCFPVSVSMRRLFHLDGGRWDFEV